MAKSIFGGSNCGPECDSAHYLPILTVARIRTWVKYGMTVPQIAAIYGAEVDETVRMLGNA